jgi:hypothetical protein
MLKACGIFTPMSRHDQTARRKLDHIKLCSDEEIDKVSYVEKSTLLECVEILPVYFPTCPLDKIDTKAAFLGKTVSAPVMISAITGGAAEAAGLNRTLAEVCQELGIPFGLGSGRIMFEDPASAESFKVRSAAPGIPIIANIGISQAEELSGEQLTWMVTELEADALAIHINFAMEAFQPEGDRQPATVVETILRIKSEVTFPIIVKEVGTGFSMQQLELLKTCDVEWLDVAGAGGIPGMGRAHGRVPDLGEKGGARKDHRQRRHPQRARGGQGARPGRPHVRPGPARAENHSEVRKERRFELPYQRHRPVEGGHLPVRRRQRKAAEQRPVRDPGRAAGLVLPLGPAGPDKINPFPPATACP